MTSILALCLAPIAAGCTSTTEGLDLTENGILTLILHRVSGSAVATAAATVKDAGLLGALGQSLVLADDQIISVNNVPLSASTLTSLGIESAYSATIEAVDEPDTYTIEFDDAGVVTSVELTPPEDFEDVTPETGDEVTYDGFTLQWEAPDDEDDATIDITLSGYALSYNSAGSVDTVEYAVAFNDLADDGSVSIGETDLQYFTPGALTLTLTRTKAVSQKTGFAAGSLTMTITKTLTLDLTDAEE